MRWRITSISPLSPDSRNCLTAWADLHRRVALNYLSPIYLNENMCKWDLLITSTFRLLFRWEKLSNCYQGILRRLLLCLTFHFISETLVCIDLNWVKLPYTRAVSWHLCIEKSNECLLKKLFKETSFSLLLVYVVYRYRHTWDIWTLCSIYCTYPCLFDELLWGDFEMGLETCPK